MTKQKKNWCCYFRLVLDWLDYNNNILKLYTDHTGNIHDTIDLKQIPTMDKYIRYSEASKISWYQSIHDNHSP